MQQLRTQSSSAVAEESDLVFEDGLEQLTSRPRYPSSPYPSPLPEAARKSAKLAALHSRLALPPKLPLETIARALVDPSADPNSHFNNASLAQVGGSILSYHVSEYLICTYPRLPMSVLYAAQYAYCGPKTLNVIGQEWGVESAAVPGSEVDAGLLQFSKMAPGTPISKDIATTRADRFNWRRGLSSRVVYDDDFGDLVNVKKDESASLPTEDAYSNFVKAVVGAVFVHGGRESAKNFVKQHVLSRHLDLASLFQFKEPVKELAKLCHREDFEYPVARLVSETGRHSRTPVFVVGIFSGTDKLGEGAGASLMEARIRACVEALKAWYLYSPGNNARVPSDMEKPHAKGWEPVHIDMGEVIH
jgi:dsRNA-specific ribonuclease